LSCLLYSPLFPYTTLFRSIDFIGNFKNAHKVLDFQGLLPFEDDEDPRGLTKGKSRKEILNLPLGCEVHLDDRVIEIFASQTLDRSEEHTSELHSLRHLVCS